VGKAGERELGLQALPLAPNAARSLLRSSPSGDRETALGRRCPRRHGPLARLRLGRLGRAGFPGHAGLSQFPDTPL